MILILAFFVAKRAETQTGSRVDSLEKLLRNSKNDTIHIAISNELTLAYLNFDLKVAEENALKTIQFANKAKYERGLAQALYLGAIIDMSLGKMKDCINKFNEAVKHFKSLGEKKGESDCYNKLGNIKEDQGKYPEALQEYLKALKLREEIGDSVQIASSKANIGNINMFNGNFKEALTDYKYALSVFRRWDYKRGIAAICQSIFITYDRLGKKLEAEEYIEEALVINRQMDNKLWIAANLEAIGSINMEKKNYKKALINFKEAFLIDENIGNKVSAIYSSRLMGEVYLRLGNYSLAEKYVTQSVNISKSINSLINIKTSYEVLSEIESNRGDFKRAFDFYRKAIKYRDSVYNQENTKELMQQQVKYEFDKKEAIAKVEQEKKEEILKEEVRVQKFTRDAFVIGFILVLLAASSFFLQRNRIKAEKRKSDYLRRTVEEKQSEIIDSITYAKRIQEAILPPSDFLRKHLPESFMLYLPKDIVAGDFYWAEFVDNRFFIAVADSTGHGVPGAMVSVVCSGALSRSVKEFKLQETGKVLDKTRELVVETFQRSETEVKDGMDISLICIDRQSNKVTWSGANNSVYFISNGALMEVKGDKQPIGKVDNPQPFETHVLEINSGTIFYMTTDGFVDQFGGPKGKKFMQKQFKSIIKNVYHLQMEEQLEVFYKTLADWKGNMEQVDDITVFAFKI